MKTLCTLLLTTLFLWSSPLAAEYCTTNDAGEVDSCILKINGLPKNTQVIISRLQEGWTLMLVVFLDEFAMVENDAKVQIGRGDKQNMKYITTHRDVTPEGQVMEAAVYQVTEELLHNLSNADGKVRFYLASSQAKVDRIPIVASRFSELDEYIAETQSALGLSQASK
jgi:hypothetical protein